MWEAILGIGSGLILIVSLILKHYYKQKDLEPFKRRLKYVMDEAKKREAERVAHLTDDDFLSLAGDCSDIGDAINRVRQQEKTDNPTK